MGTWYVDLDLSMANDQLGTTLKPWGGPGGLQYALDAMSSPLSGPVAAGDTVRVKGTSASRLDRLVRFTCGDITGKSWAVGDVLADNGGSTGDWTGVLAKIITETSVVVELTGAYYYANAAAADGISNATRSNTTTTSAKAVVPINLNTSIGTVGARLTIVGCKDDASWTIDGTRVKLDANDVVTNCVVANGTGDYWTLANCELAQATGDGIDYITSNSVGVILENIYSHDHGGWGFDLLALGSGTQLALVRKCRASLNVGGGFTLGYASVCDACEAMDNTGAGFKNAGLSVQVYVNCISHNNGSNLEASGNSANVYINCVIDDANIHGATFAGATGSEIFLGCRVTNNGNGADEFGLNIGNAGNYAFLAHCLFTGNLQAGAANGDLGGTTANIVQMDVAAGNTNILDGTDAGGDGYVDDSTHDFNLTDEARLRATADVLPDA